MRQAADIVELVGAKTQLRRVGARWTGRCPFDERTPSFSVSRKKTYYCFGCGAGGDVITFVRETEGLDFVEAIEWLADRSPGSRSSTRRARRRLKPAAAGGRLLSLLEDAARFYSHGSSGPRGRAGARVPDQARSR